MKSIHRCWRSCSKHEFGEGSYHVARPTFSPWTSTESGIFHIVNAVITRIRCASARVKRGGNGVLCGADVAALADISGNSPHSVPSSPVLPNCCAVPRASMPATSACTRRADGQAPQDPVVEAAGVAPTCASWPRQEPLRRVLQSRASRLSKPPEGRSGSAPRCGCQWDMSCRGVLRFAA